MEPRTVYPLELTSEEEVAGFRLMEIEHPNVRWGVEDRVPAIVYRFRKSYRLLKRWHPSIPDGYYYSLEIFGVFFQMPNEKPEWHPIQPPGSANLYFNGGEPNLIVEALTRWIDEGNNKHYLPRDPEAKID